MRELSDKNFGITIAYIIPGFIVLLGASSVVPTIHDWLGGTSQTGEPTFGRFLYVLLGSLTAGLIVSALRWAVVDTIHHKTGVRPPSVDYGKLPEKLDVFAVIVEANYRYYQFYANLFVAVPIGALCRVSGSENLTSSAWLTGCLLEAVLFCGSRDSLHRFYDRTLAILGAQSHAGVQDEADT